MTPLDWDKFTALPGSPRDNFELLCRGAVTHAYARYGRFIALAQQPGVEFHLDIDRTGCPARRPRPLLRMADQMVGPPAGLRHRRRPPTRR